MLEEEAIDRAIGHLLDAVRESRIDGEEITELWNGTSRPLLHEGEDGLGEFLVVYSRGWRSGIGREECLRSTFPVTGDVVSDRPIRDPVAGSIVVSKLLALLQGQRFIGE